MIYLILLQLKPELNKVWIKVIEFDLFNLASIKAGIKEVISEKKNIDMIVANNLRTDGAGFGADTNIVTIITKDDFIELDKMSKFDVAHKIFDNILSMMDS